MYRNGREGDGRVEGGGSSRTKFAGDMIMEEWYGGGFCAVESERAVSVLDQLADRGYKAWGTLNSMLTIIFSVELILIHWLFTVLITLTSYGVCA
jgi:hypothetical protein